jgi:diamine N-acetyltransferase
VTAFTSRTIAADGPVKLRPLEREDLMFVAGCGRRF